MGDFSFSRAAVIGVICGMTVTVGCGGDDGAPDAAMDAVVPDASDSAVMDTALPMPDVGVDAGRSEACPVTVVADWDLETGRWSRAFNSRGIAATGSTAEYVSDLVWHGDELYVGGSFDFAGPVGVANVAAWSGATGWRSLGDGVAGSVRKLAVAADGTVYAATTESMIHRYADGSWSSIGAASGSVLSLAVDRDGTLLVGGFLTSIDGVPVLRLARWNGGWAAVDHPGFSVEAIFVDETGLCIGGRATNPRAYVACRAPGPSPWTNYALPAQPGPPYPAPVNALLRDSAGDLVAAGAVVLDADRDAGGIVRWDESLAGWEMMGPGFGSSGAPEVTSAVLAGDGSVWAVGAFSTLGPLATSRTYLSGVSRWAGGRWMDVGGLQGGAYRPALRSVAEGGSHVYVGGGFTEAFNATRARWAAARGVARWNGIRWEALSHPSDPAHGPGGVTVLAGRGACGPYVAGAFQVVEDSTISHVGELGADDALAPAAPDGYLSNSPSAMALAADGTLYVGGSLELYRAGGARERAALMRRVGGGWEPFGPISDSFGNRVNALAIDVDGALYVGGAFVDGSEEPGALLRWDGTAWSGVGTREPNEITAIAFAEGGVCVAELVEPRRSRVACWDGAAWTQLGDPLGGVANALIAHDGTIVAGGSELTPTSAVARWTDGAWVAEGTFNGWAADFAALGETLLVVGRFALDPTALEDVNAAYLAGVEWRPIGRGIDGGVSDVLVTDEGLLFGGFFSVAGSDAPSWGLARFEPGG